jgi:predicted ATP-dependent endonuclease of OLD family
LHFKFESALFYIESINVSFPQLINSAIEDVYEGKYSNTRLSGAKKQVKDSYSEYLSSLQEILQELSSELTSLFSIYNQEWKVDFRYEGSLSKFVDLISDDVKVHINDGSNLSIEGKGSGLQRLAYILLNYFVARQISSQSSIIFMVDEPDVYLHHGLQKKLKDNLLDISQNHQVFLTTHSPVFIDTYNLKNVFLLDILREEVQYKRKPNEVFYKLNTTLVSMNQIDGINKIRNYLGLDELDANNLSPCNFLVEGEADKIYIESLCGFFNIPCPQIEIATGANNMPKMLDYFESISTNQSIKPKILVLLDNDSKGREIYPKITLSKWLFWI